MAEWNLSWKTLWRFLPFSFEITEAARAGENELEVIVNNIVDETTLPAGRMVHQKFPGAAGRDS